MRLREDIDRFLDADFTNEQMKAIIIDDWRAGYYDERQGRSVADWLRKVKDSIGRVDEQTEPPR